MKSEQFTNKLVDTRIKKNSWKRLAFILGISNLALCVVVIANSNNVKTIIMPPTITKSFWIENGTADPEYLRQMAHWFSGLVLTTSPDSVKYQNKLFLNYVSSRAYASLQAQLGAEAERIKRGNISQVFFQREIDVIHGKMEAAVIGRKITYIGKTETDNKILGYKIKFAMENGRVVVTDFEEADVDDPFGIKTRQAQEAAKVSGVPQSAAVKRSK